MSIEHSLITAANGHGILSSLGPYASATARRAAVVSAADVAAGKVCLQTDTGEIYFLASQASGVPTWIRINTTADASSFTGDFGARFASYSGLTVRAYRRGDLGVTGTTGTGKSSWANQMGDGSAITPGASNSSNGIGSVSSLNSKATVLLDGSTQCGQYTFPSSVAPGTANQHVYRVQRMLTTTGGYVAASTGGPYILKPGATGDQQIGNGSGGGTSSGEAINVWHRMRCSWIGGLDVIRVGSHEPTPSSTSNNGPGTTWGFGANASGLSLASMEVALDLHITGPYATFLTAAADVDALLAGFWSGATAIEI